MTDETEADLTGGAPRRRPKPDVDKVGGRKLKPSTMMTGHGYDPMFQPRGHEVTLGQMERWEKNRISHRADAFRKLAAACLD